jgi:class 3 adenylate cyclase/tetratricopeptide (TPR) repeat protein
VREQRKVVTVLFCDLVGSTSLGETTDPEALRARMRGYFEDLRSIVERHGGTVEKFVGDAVMAVFGIPTAHEDDALRAVRAASEMRDAIAAHGLEARIGLDTGEVVVGGEGETLVTGDTVNVAARLEQAAAPGEALMGAETRLLVRDAARVEPVQPLELKGKARPVEAYRLVDVSQDVSSPSRHPETPLVGRERERERLWRDYEDAVADRACRLFTLLGPAGIGKSRLVADFLERLGDSADVLRGRCLSYGEGITYWPLVEMLAPLAIAPETVVSSTPEETRVAFRRLLEARGSERPQVVVIEDLQWAEPVFVDLVEHVADLSRGTPIFLLCIARNELLETRPGWGGGKLNSTSLLLEPLDADECSQLVDRLVPGLELEEGLRGRIVEASAGYPLYVEEMLAMVREHGERAIAVPPTIQALLQARIDALEPDLRTVLERGAVEGEVFHRSALAALVPEHVRPGVDGHLTSLVRRELVRPEAALVQEDEAFRFRHLLIREAAYAAMPKELRAGLHERLAAWLEAADLGSTFELDEILGYHLEQSVKLRAELGRAGPAEEELAARAGSHLVAAGIGASGRADFHGAASLLQRAVDLVPEDDPAGIEPRIVLAEALVRRGELQRAEALLRVAFERARALGDRGLESRARLASNSLRTRTDPDARVEDELDEALEIAAWLEPTGDLPTLARAHIEIGTSRFQVGHAREGAIDLRRAVDLARQAGETALAREAANARLRLVAWGPTPASEGLEFCTMLLDNEATNAAQRAHALQVRALCEAFQGRVDEARTSSSHAWALIEEFGLRLQGASYAMDVGWAELLSDDLDRAEHVLRRGHDLVVEVGDTGQQSTIDALLAEVLLLRRRYDEASSLATGVRAIAGIDDLDAQPRWRAALARVLSVRDEQEQALALVREAVALVEPIDLVVKATVFDALGEVLARAGKAEEAAVALERAIALHEQKGNVVSAGHSRAALAGLRAVGQSETVDGRW